MKTGALNVSIKVEGRDKTVLNIMSAFAVKRELIEHAWLLLHELSAVGAQEIYFKLINTHRVRVIARDMGLELELVLLEKEGCVDIVLSQESVGTMRHLIHLLDELPMLSVSFLVF